MIFIASVTVLSYFHGITPPIICFHYTISFIGSKEYRKLSYTLASYDKENGFGGIFASIKKLSEAKNISKEVSTAFTELSESAIKKAPDIQKVLEGYKVGEKSAIKFAEGIKDGSIQLKEGQTAFQGYQAYLKSTSTALSLADVKTKALSVSMKVLSTIGWMAAFAAATWAIGKGIEAIDNYVHRLDKAKEAFANTESDLSSVKSEIETTTDRIKELEAMDSLSITDKEDLQRLKDQNEELRIRQQYLEKQKQSNAEKVANLTKEKYSSQYTSKSGSIQDDIDKYRSLYGQSQTQNSYSSTRGNSGIPGSMSYAPGSTANEYNIESASLANLIAQYQYYQEEKSKAIAANDEASIEKYNAKLKETDQKLMDNRTTLQGFSDDLAGEASPELDGISEKLKLIDNLLLTPGQNLINFIDSDALKDNKEQLVTLADSGELTAQVLSTKFADVDAYLKENGLTLEDLISVVKTYKDELSEAEEVAKKSEFENLPIDKIEEYVSLVKSGKIDEETIASFSELKKLMSDTGMNAKDAAKALKDYADGYTLSTDLISNMQGAYDLLMNVGEQYKKTGLIGLSSLESIVKQYPQLRTAVNEYVNGLISAENMMTQLQTAYDNDAIAFRSAMAYKLSGNEDFFSTIVNNNQSLFNDLSKAYGLDVENWKTMAQAKAEIDQKLIQSLSTAWSKYYNIVFDSVSGLASLDGMDLSRAGSHGVTVSQEQQEAWSAATKQANKYNQIINKLNEAASIQVETPDFGGIGSVGSKSGSKKDKKETEKPIDWIERDIQKAFDEREKLMKKASDSSIDYLGITNEEFSRATELFNSNLEPMSNGANELAGIAKRAGLSLSELYTLIANGNPGESRENYLAQVLESDKTLLPKIENAVEQYKLKWEEAANKISPENKAKIELGSMSIDTLSGDELKNVETAMGAFDKYQSMQDSYAEAQKKNTATIIAQYDNRIASINKENEQLEKSNSILEARIDYLKTMGEIPSASLYEKLIQNTGTEISNTKKEISAMKAKLRDAFNKHGKNSEEYADLEGEIREAEKSLYGMKKAQEEYNNKLLQMPIENASILVSMYQDIGAAIRGWGDDVVASGGKLDANYYQSLISNGATVVGQLQKQSSLIKDVMDNYEVGSDNWNDLYKQLQSVNSEMSSAIQNIRKFNEELLKMPLENMGNFSSELQKVADGLSKVQSEQDQVISAVTGAIKDQIDLLNEQKDAVNEQKKAEIDALKEKLKLLEKSNEERKLLFDLEQKQYDLERARNQKTNKVVRNGVIDYEEDTQARREAEQALLDSQYNLEKYNLQEQIDKAQESLDLYNDGLQEQIDALQKISDKWSEISEKTIQYQNEAKADDILGTGWKDKVLSGNDEALFNTFSGMYANTAEQLKKYQDQIDSTNNIQALLEDYIASYKAGEITYAEAVNGINGLLSQLNQTMSATDNLQNIFDYLGTVNDTAANADAILAGIQSGLKDTATELLKSLEQYNKNSGMISEYTSSWQQLTNNVTEMLKVLKEVRNNLEDSYDYERDRDNDNTRYGGGKDGSPGTPGKGDYVNSGPGAKLATSRKDGITRGLVGSASDSDREAKMKLLGLKKLEPDELPAVLHMGEAVFNDEQQNNLLKNLASAYSFKPYTKDYSSILNGATVREPALKQEFKFGDINIQKCDNENELARGILNGGLLSAINQEKSKR